MDRTHLHSPSSLVALVTLVTLVIGLASPDVTAQQATPSGTRQEFLARLDELARSAPTPEVRVGDHWIRGRVVTEAGQPLEGVHVRARRTDLEWPDSDRRAFSDAADEATLTRSLQASAAFWFVREENKFDTTSGADGTYAFERLVDGRFEMETWIAGFSVEPVTPSPFRRISVDGDSTVDFVARPMVARTFDVLLPDGSRPERALLELVRVGDSNRYSTETWTPADPVALLPAGDWRITASSGPRRRNPMSSQDSSFISKPVLVTVTPPDAGEVVPLRLRGIPAIEGKVRLAAGALDVSLRVIAVQLQPGQEPDPKLIMDADPFRDRDVKQSSVDSGSDRGGTFRLAPITAGRWLIGLRDYGKKAPLATAVVEVGEGCARHDFVVEPVDPDGDLRVRVLDPDGGLLRDCEFTRTSTFTTPDGQRNTQSGGVNSRKLPDGSFAFQRDEIGRECTLFARHPRFGTLAHAVPPDARAVEVRFLPPATPTFRLARYAELARDRKVALEVAGEDERRDRRQPLRLEGDAIAGDGTIDVGRLQPGTYLFRLFVRPQPGEPPSKWRTYDEREIAVAEFELAAGPRTLEMPFPALSKLRISGMPLQKADYFLVPAEATPLDESRVFRHAEPDADGVLVYTDLPPGTFEFRGPLGATMLVETPAAEVVRFVADAIRVLRVTVVDSKGALALAGLVTGDRIVAIDGREFESREELERIRQSLRGEEVTLTVQRGGKRFEIAIGLAPFRGRKDAGGAFTESPR